MNEFGRTVAEMITRDSVKSEHPGLEEQAKRSKLLGNTNGKYPNPRNWNPEILFLGKRGYIGPQNLTCVDYTIPKEPLRDPMIVM